MHSLGKTFTELSKILTQSFRKYFFFVLHTPFRRLWTCAIDNHFHFRQAASNVNTSESVQARHINTFFFFFFLFFSVGIVPDEDLNGRYNAMFGRYILGAAVSMCGPLFFFALLSHTTGKSD